MRQASTRTIVSIAVMDVMPRIEGQALVITKAPRARSSTRQRFGELMPAGQKGRAAVMAE